MNLGWITHSKVGGVGPVNPYPVDWDKVRGLYHFDGNFADSSSAAKTATVLNTGAVIDSTNKKFGSGSLYTASPSGLQSGTVLDFNSDFCVEL